MSGVFGEAGEIVSPVLSYVPVTSLKRNVIPSSMAEGPTNLPSIPLADQVKNRGWEQDAAGRTGSYTFPFLLEVGQNLEAWMLCC